MGTLFSCCVTEEEQKLLELNYKSAPEFSLNGLTLLCKIVDCYDGDTVTAAVLLNGQPVSFRCRLFGIDAPEMKNSTKAEAIAARNALVSMCSSVPFADSIATRDEVRTHLENHKKLMKIECGEWDKYGRLLVTLKCNDANFRVVSCNQGMIDGGFAKAYFGGTKI